LTILHVEDDDNDALLFAKACERAQLPVILQRIGDAETAKSYLLGEGEFFDRLVYPLPQVIILDLKLPGITGFDFITWLRQQPCFTTTPVLVFTASLSREDKARAISDGANSFFVKPASFEVLVQMVGALRIPEPGNLN
jgi:DNA-binding response OmpR family regulator